MFPQSGAQQRDNFRLYAQFKSQSDIDIIYRHVSKLKTAEHKVSFYAPFTHQDQLKHLSSLAYRYRFPENPANEKCKTRIKFGVKDLVLQVKPISSRYWSTIQVKDLPPIRSISTYASVASSPPPPGRRRHEASNKRGASSSPQAQSNAKDPRIEHISQPELSLNKVSSDQLCNSTHVNNNETVSTEAANVILVGALDLSSTLVRNQEISVSDSQSLNSKEMTRTSSLV